MSRSFKLSCRDRSTRAEVSTRVEIPDDDWVTLIAFADGADELRNSQVFQAGLRVQLKIKWNATTGLAFEGILPPNDVIAALLHRVRPFVLQKEATSFFRVRNILAKHMVHPELRRMLDFQRDLFSGKDFQEQLRIESATPILKGVVNSGESFQKWLNAFEYHHDPQKRAEIEQLCGILTFDAARAVFVSMLLDKLKSILFLATIIRRCESADGQPLRVPT